MKSTSVMRSGQQIVRSLHPSELSSELSSLARNDQVNCRYSVPAGPRWLFNLMSYCRRPLERDVYTATGFRAANDWPFMLNEFAGSRFSPPSCQSCFSLLRTRRIRRNEKSVCIRALSACVHSRICGAAPLAGISMPWQAQREPIDN